MYDQVKALVAGQPGGTGAVAAISQNFRTTPAVLEWVNSVFAGVFDDEQRPAASLVAAGELVVFRTLQATAVITRSPLQFCVWVTTALVALRILRARDGG